MIRGNNRPIITHNKYYLLRAKIRDNAHLEDVYILQNSTKIFYRALRNRSKLNIRLRLKLKKGRNHIFIMARETEKFLGYKELFILYRP